MVTSTHHGYKHYPWLPHRRAHSHHHGHFLLLQCLLFSSSSCSTPNINISYISSQFHEQSSVFIDPTDLSNQSQMEISGFEGFEKRLELHFSNQHHNLGLRLIPFNSIQCILKSVQCTMVSAVGNQHFDAYVLSESSLFVYPDKIIIKTCGTTLVLRSIPCLLDITGDMGIHLCRCRYTRGSFIFPKSQPFPHTSFKEEVEFLEETLPHNLCFRKACVLPSSANKTSTTNQSWHVFSASTTEPTKSDEVQVHQVSFTMEVCMTKLDRDLATRFYCGGGDVAGRVMTGLTRIDDINPMAIICDYGFDPCGYSMNGMDGSMYSTIHVTPEDGYSYASFECNGEINGDEDEIEEVLKKVVNVFRPGTMSVSVTIDGGGGSIGRRLVVGGGLKLFGLICKGRKVEEFPGGETLTFQTFKATRRKQ